MTPIILKARDIPDLWFQALKHISVYGRNKKIDVGSYAGQSRWELDFFQAFITHPGSRPLIPETPINSGVPNPVDEKYLLGHESIGRSYIEYVMTTEKTTNEEYTYGERIVPQLDWIVETYKKGHTNNQLTIRVSQPEDCILENPPCLQLIDTNIIEGHLNFYIYFRSWEAWAGLPTNLAGLQILKEYLAMMIGVKDGQMVVMSKGLHIYDHSEEHVNIILGGGK
jgi:thymidylate synthase